MKLGIDISQIVYQGTGVARFTQGLVETILQYDKNNAWTFLFYSLRQNLSPPLEQKIRAKGHKLIKWSLPPSFVSLLNTNFPHLIKLLTFNFSFLTSLDWFITSDWIELFLGKINKTTIVHDLVFKRYPQTVDKKILNAQETRLKRIKNESKIIFADSQSTKKDLISFYNLDSNKIIVNYPGIQFTKPTKKQVEKALKKYHLDKPFILAAGKLEPRKNIPTLVEAFVKTNRQGVDLIIVGPKGWNMADAKYRLSNIKYLGYVNDEELYSLYSGCLALVFPSLWEGFGYPLVEAMALEVPVACSKIAPFEEIAQKNALYFNPFSTEEISHCINLIIQNDGLRKKIATGGKIRAKDFTWKSYYQKLINSLYDYRR